MASGVRVEAEYIDVDMPQFSFEPR